MFKQNRDLNKKTSRKEGKVDYLLPTKHSVLIYHVLGLHEINDSFAPKAVDIEMSRAGRELSLPKPDSKMLLLYDFWAVYL